MFWLSCLAEVILFLESGHTERQRERERERGGGGGRGGSEIEQNLPLAWTSLSVACPTTCMQRRDKRLERECMSRQRRVSKRTVAYRPVVSIRLSRSLGFPTCLFLVSLLSGQHERCPMASRKEQLSSSFFVAWTTQTLHENLSMGFRRAKFTQRNTNLQKNIFVDDRLRGDHPREVRCSFYEFSKPIRFCSNLVETLFNPFPIRKCKKNWGSPCWFSRWRWSKFPWLHAHFRSGFSIKGKLHSKIISSDMKDFFP